MIAVIRVVRATHVGVVIVLAGGALTVAACARQTPARQAADTARREATVAATAEQARLWREAADKGLTAGLQRLPVVERPVERRSQSQAVSQQVPAQPVVIPAGVLSAVRILAAPALSAEGFVGSAAVRSVADDRLDLDLGLQRILAVLARAGGKPIPTSAGDTVQVDYHVRTDPRVPRDVLAIRTTAGKGIVSVVQGGNGPVTVTVPLFGLTARQIGSPPSMSVDVGVGDAHRTMAAGETAQIGGLNVTLLGSSAYTGESAERIEGSPYSINLIAWPSP